VAQKDEAAARRRGGRARDRRLRCGRRRLDGNGAGDRARRAAGSRHAGGGEEEARGRGAGAGEQCGGKRRSWSSHLPEAMGWVDLAADMGCHGLTGGEEGMDRRVALCLLYYLFLVRSRFCRFYFSSTCII
jgi:hypothetical protein